MLPEDVNWEWDTVRMDSAETDYFPAISGVLVLGIGDAAASVIGTLFGRQRWSKTNRKTLEGSLGAVLTVLLAAAGIAWSSQMVHRHLFRWFAPPIPETTVRHIPSPP